MNRCGYLALSFLASFDLVLSYWDVVHICLGLAGCQHSCVKNPMIELYQKWKIHLQYSGKCWMIHNIHNWERGSL